jgi:DNA helicase-2/ATP-dependent DNA helicase PcrA
VSAAFAPSAHQARFFDWVRDGRGSAILNAVAGAGKSTSVVQAQPYIPEGKHVILLAFNKDAADDLAVKLDRLREATGRVFANRSARTFHSVGQGAVRKFLTNTVLNVDKNKVRDLAREVIDGSEVESYESFVCDLVSLAKAEGIGALVPDLPEAWWSLVRHHDLVLATEGASEERAIEFARQVMRRSEIAARSGRIDFDDMLYLPIRWKLKLWGHDWVFVDEAQDTNPVRRAFAKLLLRPGGRLVAVGDRKQAIYGFTGASHDAIDLIQREFSAIEMPLSVCYRCSKAVVAYAKEITPYIEPFDGAPEGSVESLPLSVAAPQLTASDAVLCRQTAPLIELAYGLISRGIGCVVLGRAIGDGLVSLVRKQKARGIDGLLTKLEAWRDREVAKFTAKGEEGKADAVSDRFDCVAAIVDQLPENGRTVPALIERIESLFSDSASGRLTLTTMHRAKGKEWPTVAILKPELLPSRWARQDWQLVQEDNLDYVARTRAIMRLIILTDAVLGEARR